MDIIFWNGVFVEISRSIGPYQLSHWLRKHGYDCQVIDFVQCYDVPMLKSLTEQFITDKTLFIGMSSTFWAERRDGRWKKTFKIPVHLKLTMALIRKQYPNIKFVLGGSQADYLEKETIELFDFVVSGAGEDIILDYVEDLRKNKKRVFSFETRYGIPYKTGSLNNRFKIHENDHIFIDQDCVVEGETLPIEISRGCIFKCNYCQYPYIGKKKLDYVRNMDLIRNEIEHNYKKFKSKNYFILDDTFNDTTEKMNAWFDCIDSLDFKIEYTGYFRADLLSRNEYQIEKFKNSGLASVFFGIESFNPTSAKLVGKGWSGKEGKGFLTRLKTLWKNDVTMHLSFIVGFPDDTEEDYNNTQQWCYENKMDSWVWHALGLSQKDKLFSSEFDRNPEKFGFSIDSSGNWYNSRYTAESAINLSYKLINERDSLQTQKITVWRMLYYMSMGYDSRMLKNTYAKDLSMKELREREKQFLEKYLQKLKSVSV